MLLFDDILQGLPPDAAIDAPGCEYVALREDVLDLFQRTSRSFGEAEQNVDECGEVESPEDEVCSVGDTGEAWGDGPGEGEVEEPAKQSMLTRVERV